MDSLEASDLAGADEHLKRDIETAARILKDAGATEVYLFGSAAVGKLRPESDIDLAVRGLPPQRFFSAGGAAMLAVSRAVDVIDLDERNPFVEYLETHGELKRVA